MRETAFNRYFLNRNNCFGKIILRLVYAKICYVALGSIAEGALEAV